MESRSSSPVLCPHLAEKEKKFCKETSLMLIKYYKEYPCLYDPSHPDYMERDVRAEAYSQITEKLRDFKPKITVDLVKNKLKTLYNQLHKEKMNMKRNPGYRPKLWCFRDIEFLLHNNKESRMFVSSTNIPKKILGKRSKSSTDDSDDTMHNVVDSNNISEDKPTTTKQGRNSLEKIAIATLQVAQSSVQKDKAAKQQYAPVKAFCSYLSAEMQQLRPRTFNNLKIDIMEMLNEAIMKNQQEDICQNIKEEFPSTSGNTFPMTTVTSLC